MGPGVPAQHAGPVADPGAGERAARGLRCPRGASARGEFGATITFVSNIPGETQTLPTAIYTFLQVPGGETGALRLTLVSIAISVAALFASEAIAQRASRRVAGL